MSIASDKLEEVARLMSEARHAEAAASAYELVDILITAKLSAGDAMKLEQAVKEVSLCARNRKGLNAAGKKYMTALARARASVR